jgi:hypothetical protein
MTLEGTVIKGVIVLSAGAQLPEGTQVRVELAPGEPAKSQLGSANIKYLSSLIQQLVELRNAPERDDYGVLRANKHAFDVACNLLIDTAIVSALEGGYIPYGCASTDAEGGVRIEWVRDSASVHFIVAASENRDDYIYHELGTNYGTEPATAEALARWQRVIKPASKVNGCPG